MVLPVFVFLKNIGVSVSQNGQELKILLLQLSECGHYRFVPAHTPHSSSLWAGMYGVAATEVVLLCGLGSSSAHYVVQGGLRLTAVLLPQPTS